MRIALVTDVFPPLRSSGAVQLRDLAVEFSRHGHQITVMVASPELNKPWLLEEFQGMEVLRLKTFKTRDRRYIIRTVGEFLMPFAMLRGLRQSPLLHAEFDAVIWYSPTIFLGPMIKALKKQSRCPAYLIIRDIFPEWAWEMGLIRSQLLYKTFKAVASYQYAQADVIGIQTPGNRVYFEAWQAKHPNARIEVLHNWLSETPNAECSVDINSTKLAGRKIFVYAGNMGVAQNTEVFCRLAKRLSHRGDLGFLFVGRGSDCARLAKSYGKLPNVLFCDEIPPDEITGLYAQCQVGLIALDPRHKSHNIPGKFLSYIQAGLPVLACVNAGNDLVALIKEQGVGAVVEGDAANREVDCAALAALDLSKNNAARANCRTLTQGMFSSYKAVMQILSAITSSVPFA